MNKEKFDQLVKFYTQDMFCPALVEDFRHLRDISLKELRLVRRARAAHRTLAFRPSAKVAKMIITNGFMKNVPIDTKILRVTDEILGRPPHEFIKGNINKRKTRRFRFYGGIKAKELAIEIDIMYFMMQEFLIGITFPYAHSCYG